jgi:hypothetical protein
MYLATTHRVKSLLQLSLGKLNVRGLERNRGWLNVHYQPSGTVSIFISRVGLRWRDMKIHTPLDIVSTALSHEVYSAPHPHIRLVFPTTSPPPSLITLAPALSCAARFVLNRLRITEWCVRHHKMMLSREKKTSVHFSLQPGLHGSPRRKRRRNVLRTRRGK